MNINYNPFPGISGNRWNMDIKKVITRKYGEAALRVVAGKGNSCCGINTSACSSADRITGNLYTAQQTRELPESTVQAALGCGNPTTLAALKPGEIVLDLGCGGGIDVFLSARRVFPGGRVYGLDMTDELLALARGNRKAAGDENVEFVKGDIEHIPMLDNSIDVVISNCVINLSADKDRVLHEAYRVLKPGGRFAVSDVVTRGEIPEEIKANVLLWVGCVAGALEEEEYKQKLAAAGFKNVSFEPARIFSVRDALLFLQNAMEIDIAKMAPLVRNKFMSASISAFKPL
jgi:arsenite methyltransferase